MLPRLGAPLASPLSMEKGFDYSLNYQSLDFRRHPEIYRMGRGEQGVLLVEPYKSELLPYWKFRDEKAAKQSAKKILSLFKTFRRQKDFVGMDMARKFLQMGFTRARRYANHSSGKKYSYLGGRKTVLPRSHDREKAKAARVFYSAWLKVKKDRFYNELKLHHLKTTSGK